MFCTFDAFVLLNRVVWIGGRSGKFVFSYKGGRWVQRVEDRGGSRDQTIKDAGRHVSHLPALATWLVWLHGLSTWSGYLDGLTTWSDNLV